MLLWITVILSILFIALIIIALSSLRVIIEFHRRPDLQKIKTDVFLFKRLKVYGTDIKLDQPRIDSDEEYRRLIELQIERGIDILFSSVDIIRAYNDTLKKINKKFIKGLRGDKMELAIELGTGDAAVTGLLCGTLWAGLGNLRMQRESENLFGKIKFNVRPNFNKKVFSIDISCIFTIKTVYIMYVYKNIEKIFKIEKLRIHKKNNISNNKKLLETG